MTPSRPSRPPPAHALALALALALAGGLAGCASPDTPLDPDERLAVYVAAWEARQAGEQGEPGAVRDRELPDPHLLQLHVERLALDFPEHVPTLFFGGLVAYERGEREKAQRYLDLALKLAPRHPEAAVLRARVAIDDGGLPLARRVLERQVVLAPDHAGVREALAGVLFLQGDLEAAARVLDAAEHLGAPAWRIAYHRGLVAEHEGDAEAAAAHYERCLAAAPDHAPAAARLLGLEATAAGGTPGPR